MADHPQRPSRPARAIPLRGDDTAAAFQAWWYACRTCRGCKRHVVPGGCERWEPADA